jgi:hypothetical protein
MIAAADLRLPRVDEPPPHLPLLVLGRRLAENYRDVLDQPLPEPLARMVRQIEGGAPHLRAAAGRPGMGR